MSVISVPSVIMYIIKYFKYFNLKDNTGKQRQACKNICTKLTNKGLSINYNKTKVVNKVRYSKRPLKIRSKWGILAS